MGVGKRKLKGVGEVYFLNLWHGVLEGSEISCCCDKFASFDAGA